MQLHLTLEGSPPGHNVMHIIKAELSWHVQNCELIEKLWLPVKQK